MKFCGSRAFALPAVLMSSIVMLIVMLAAVTSTVSSRVSLESQYYNQLSKTAGEAGIAYAKACIAQNSGTPQWTDAKPLKPNTDCSGNQLAGFTCEDNSVDTRCSVSVVGSNVIASFSVPAPLPDTSGAFTNISSSGSVVFLRTSSNEVWRQYKNTVKASKSPLGGLSDGVASSPEVTWKQSESGYWKQISTGTYHTCAIASNDQAYCWGNNSYGLLGNNSVTQSNIPVAVVNTGVLNGLTIKSISAGDDNNCALASNSQVYCWGYNGNGELGNNSSANSSVPVAVVASGVLSGLSIKSVSTGSGHTCVVASNDQAYCWGNNTNGTLGNNSTGYSPVPVAVVTTGVLNGLTIKSIDIGGDHTCAIASNDKVYCWGYDAYGALGDNYANTESHVPVAVVMNGALSGLTVKSISAGVMHTCAIASNDLTYCWGFGGYGELGNNLTSNSPVPVAVTTTGALNGLTIKSVSVGNSHSCAIASNNQVYCWGNNPMGVFGNSSVSNSSVPVPSITSGLLAGLSIKSISSKSYNHTCVIASNDQVYCWGYGYFGQLGNNSTSNSNVPISVVDGAFNSTPTSTISSGTYHTCAIAINGQVYCWGLNSSGQLGNGTTTNSSIPTPIDTSGALNGLTVKSIVGGQYFTCAIASNDQVYCWGYNSNGQLGNNATTQSSVPIAVTNSGVLNGLTVKSISVGTDHACAIASDNQVYCWGSGNYGQLGNGLGSESHVPVAVTSTGVLSGLTIKSISSKSNYTCVTASNNLAYCWGGNPYGQLGNISTTNAYAPVAVTTSGLLTGLTIKSINAGGYGTCVIASNDLAYCWGYNASGQLGDGSNSDSHVPVAVSTNGALSGLTIKSIAPNLGDTCAIASNDKVYCWGGNSFGILGNDSTTASNTPVAVSTSGALDGLNIRSITTGSNFNCAIASNSQAYCWGRNDAGQLGNSAITESHIPVKVSISGVLLDPSFNPISAGFDHNCVIAADKKAYCWGSNAYGQLGNNSTTQSNTPVAVDITGVLSGLTIKSISAGQNFTCAVASNDKSYCWGRNYWGQLGNNSTTDSHVPVAVYDNGVLNGLTIKAVVTGYYHTCVIASNGQVYCWGDNLHSQLGNNSTTGSYVPVAVYTGGALNGLSIRSISGGSMHNCVIASNNQAYCWGFNNSGQMGNGTSSDYPFPVSPITTGVLNGLYIKSISASIVHTCAIASNNQLYCWGDNYQGQLGDGTNTIKYTPVATYTGGALNGLTVKYVSSSAGGTHTCVIASNNQPYCWGQNTYGQLGNNTVNNSYEPSAVNISGALNGLTAKSISSGAYHTCVIASNDRPYCWGQNTSGQLGNNSVVNSLVPTPTYITSGFGWFNY